MNIKLTWDQSQLEVFAGEAPARFAYASVNAISGTLKRIQQAEFSHAREEFAIRKQAFFFGTYRRVGGVAARITTFPSVKRGIAFGEIEGGALPKGGDELSSYRRLLYGGFETGAERKPFTPGAKSVAVPLTGGPARPSAGSSVTPSLTFAQMRMQAYVGGRRLTRNTRSRKKLGVGLLGEYGRLAIPEGGGRVQWKGKNGTFIVFTDRRPLGEVLQRTGKGSVRLAWLFERPFRLDRRLRFEEIAVSVAAAYFREECERQLQDVMAHDVKRALRAVA